MNVFVHNLDGTQVAEVQSEGIIIRSGRDATDIAGELLSRGINRLILHERNLCPEFWQTVNGLAGVILQEFASKAVAVAFVGKLEQKKREYLSVLIQDNDLGSTIFMVDTVELARKRLSKG